MYKYTSHSFSKQLDPIEFVIKKQLIFATILLGQLLFFISSCSNTYTKKIDLLNGAEIKYEYNTDNKVQSISVEFAELHKITDGYLYIKCNGKFVLSINNDTIGFNKIQVQKLPFYEARVISQKALDFELVYFDSLCFNGLNILLTEQKEKNKIRLKTISILSKAEFNNLFEGCPIFESSDLPIIKIETNNSITVNNEFGTLSVFNSLHKKNNALNSPNYKGCCKLKIRGQTSKKFNKKSFKIVFTDSINRNIELLGMPKEHDWILNGPYIDISHIRNKFAYDLSRRIGQYAPRSEFCELIINNEYLGIYLLTETIKADKNRVNIEKNNFGDDTIKSFIVKIDHGGKSIFVSNFRSEIDSGWEQYFKPVYPKIEKLSEKNIKTIKGEIDKFELSLLKNGNDYLNHINLKSFVDYFILNELTKNIDAYRLSAFIHKNHDTKIEMGPIWDFNYSLGLTEYNNGFDYKGWVFKYEAVPFWWKKLLQKPEFKELLIKRWEFLRNENISIQNMFKMIDNLYLGVEPAQKRNFIRWDVFNETMGVRYNKVASLEEEIEIIKEWIEHRVLWIDENIKIL